MKILCSLSGVEFTVEHFPGYLTSREVAHPVFSIPQKKLLPYISKWASAELTTTDSYLLFLSILNSSELVEFRVPAARSELTDSIVAQNMEALAKTVSRLNSVTNPSVVFPRYVISPETKYLTNVKYWIENWNDCWNDFQDGYSKQLDSRKLVVREAALERMIKNPHLPLSAYASKIAEWAAIAGDFPENLKTSPFTGEKITVSEYWKEIIARCSREESIFSVPQSDIAYLLTHCETNISIGSIYSNALFKVLRHAIDKQKNFLGLGDMDLNKSKYQILSEDSTTETANLQAMIDSAPDHEPNQSEYPNKLAYLKAKLRWQTARKYTKLPESSDQSEGEPNV
jgi:hypothetical protein